MFSIALAMRLPFLIVLLLGLLGFTRAQSIAELTAELPSCALNCIFQFLPDSSCSATDIPCICGNADLWTNVTACVQPACTVKEALTAQKVSTQTCHTPVRDRHRELQVTSLTLAGVSFLMVVIRLIARKPTQSQMFGWDDALIVLAFLTGFPLALSQWYMGEHGLGQDIWTRSFDDVTEVMKLFYMAEVFYLTTTVLTKISILFFYLRVFSSFAFRRVVWAVTGFCTAFYISFLFALIFQCRPISYAWTRWDGQHQGQCINIGAGIFSHAAINMVLDLVVLILPLPMLWNMQLAYSIMGRIHIFIMFSFGLVVTIISALRLQTLVNFFNSRNPTYDFFAPSLWSALEVYIGIICACLPAAKVFLFRVAPKWVGLSTVGSTAQRGPTPQRFSKSWATNSRASSANGYSKPPQRMSRIISAIPEEGDFLPLQDSESITGKSDSYPIQGIASEATSKHPSLIIQIHELEPPPPMTEPKRHSWKVTGVNGRTLQTFSSPRVPQSFDAWKRGHPADGGSRGRESWPMPD